MMAVTPELYDTIVHIVDQRVGEVKVTREDFDKLTKTVSELAGRVRELAEAQKRTDERLQELAGAQKGTEQRLGALAEAQKRTEVALRELAEAQKRTNEAVGRLTDTIGHDLESVARVSAPNWLQVYEDIKVPCLERRIFKVDGEDMEINLYGEGMKGRAPITVVGEAKSTIHGRDVEAFSARVDRLKSQLRGRIIKLMFGYWIHPSAEQEAKKLQVHVIAPPGTYPTAKPAKSK
jgi:hypothetical protein